jgi:hypothetical protein
MCGCARRIATPSRAEIDTVAAHHFFQVPAVGGPPSARRREVAGEEEPSSGVYTMRGSVLQGPIMQNLFFILTALAAAALLGNRPAQAYDEGRWCIVSSQGKERCEFRDFAACQQEIASGKRGFCNENPRWTGSPSKPTPSRKGSR